MPIPFIIGAAAAIAAAGGLAAGGYGAKKMYDSNKTMEQARSIHDDSVRSMEAQHKSTCMMMDEVGRYELTVMKSFRRFSDLIEQIHNRPDFKKISRNDAAIPAHSLEDLKEASVGAAVLLGALGGAGLGAAGGIAASGATTAAVMALGTAGTGTAISALSGAAATNATLALLGGGTLAAGGGGVALGTALLGASTLGIGLLVGGAIFALSGSKLSEKADEAMKQARECERQAAAACARLKDIEKTGELFYQDLRHVDTVYTRHLESLDNVISVQGKTDWNDFTPEEQRMTENTVLLVHLLYSMCKVELTVADPGDSSVKVANRRAVGAMKAKVSEAMQQL
ncbi:MAG: hypothetical protein Q4F72_07370 [Desulfovibrionaceae bacterium]|nr:hypothetical protein [Desulfovibrionaceae bacterium]